MDNYKIAIFIVLSVFMIPSAYAQVEIIEEIAIPIGVDDSYSQVNADISFIVEIDKENIEKSEYILNLSNLGNDSIEGYVELQMGFIPEWVNVLIDGENAEVIKQQESYTGSRYRVKIDMEPKSNNSIEISYEVLKTPQQWNVGLWALQYNYNTPINVQFSSTEEEYVRTNTNYDGQIVLGYEPSKLNCNNCVLNGNTITVDDSNYFYVNWEKKRVPYRAGILYLLMIAGIVYYLVKMRK